MGHDHHLPRLYPPVARLFALATTPTDRPTFRAACEAIAPHNHDKRNEEDYWSFPLDPSGEPRLLVGVDESAITAAVLSLCWWDTADRDDHESDAAFAAERAEFDRL